MDLTKIAGDAVASAAATAPKTSAPDYDVLAGPFETPGARSDAFITKAPSGIVYLEDRPRQGGRVKRVPLASVASVFPQVAGIAPEPTPPAKPAAKGK